MLFEAKSLPRITTFSKMSFVLVLLVEVLLVLVLLEDVLLVLVLLEDVLLVLVLLEDVLHVLVLLEDVSLGSSESPHPQNVNAKAQNKTKTLALMRYLLNWLTLVRQWVWPASSEGVD